MVVVGIFGWVSVPSPSASLHLANYPTNALRALAEFGSIELGDMRSNRRMVQVFGHMLNSPGKSIPQCTHSVAEAKAFYRLLDNPVVTDEMIFDVHRKCVLDRARASSCAVLLAIQDTTTCNYDTHKCVLGLGSISSNQAKANFAGLHVHSTLLTAADEDQVFGLLGAKLYARDPSITKARKPGERDRQPIIDKESYRWMESFEMTRLAQSALRGPEPAIAQPTPPSPPTAEPAAEPATAATAGPLIVNVGDREADIYELLAEAQLHRDQGLGLLVRSQHNRSLVEDEEALLWQRLEQSPSLGSAELKLPRSQGEKARRATLQVRVLQVQIAVPAHKAKYQQMSEPVQATIIELNLKTAVRGAQGVALLGVTRLCATQRLHR
jgi:Transposase DNA-binding